MDHNFQAYLYDIINACQNITAFTSALNFEQYRVDIRTKAACERMFEYAQIPDADHIIAFRNIIAHGYDVLDDQLIWSSIKNEVPQLRLKCEDVRNASHGVSPGIEMCEGDEGESGGI